MKNFPIALLVSILLFTTSCKKDNLQPSKPSPIKNLEECKTCDGGTWDLDEPKDTIPQ